MADLDPFVHMDQMGEVLYAPGEPKGTPWHPHRGFETVTYMIDGTFQHRDSIGGGGLIENGGTQWMTAGSGILHIERPPEALVVSGGLFHGIQLWVNLPSQGQDDRPALPGHHPGRGGPRDEPRRRRARPRHRGPRRRRAGPGRTHTPISMVHATVAPGARLELPWDPGVQRARLRACGPGTVGEDAAAIAEGQLAVLGAGDHLVAAPATHRRRAPTRSSSSSWAASRSASRSRPTAPSS